MLERTFSERFGESKLNEGSPPKDFSHEYREEVTDPSLEELLRFGGWLNEVYGFHPIIIGGWAVFFHAGSLQSKDIDIVLPTRENVETIMYQWYDLSGYVSEGWLERAYYKEVQTEKGPVRIEMDAASYQDRNPFRERLELEIPWNLCESHSEGFRKKGVDLRIPSKALLLAYKTKAVRDRRFRLRHAILPDLARQALVSKVWKDEYDIARLLEIGAESSEALRIVDSGPAAELLLAEWQRLGHLG